MTRSVAVRWHDTLDSTNEEARRLAQSGEAGPLWIAAREQSHGRGRRGRAWVSKPGNLFATLMLRTGRPPETSAQLSFAAALAVGDTVAHFAPDARIALKWPNDVLLEGRKLAGILLESGGNGSPAGDWLAIGIGVNLAHCPDDAEFPAISLAAHTETAPAPEDALARLACLWDTWYEVWEARGFPYLRDAWLARAAGLGSRIRARLHNEEIAGVFEGMDSTGALILGQGNGRTRIIAAADVFFV